MTFNIPGIDRLTAEIKRLADLYERDLNLRGVAPSPPEPGAETRNFTYTDPLHDVMMENDPVYRRKHQEGAEELEEMIDEKPEGAPIALDDEPEESGNPTHV